MAHGSRVRPAKVTPLPFTPTPALPRRQRGERRRPAVSADSSSGPPPVTAYIALGANLGDRAANIYAAVRKLDQPPGVTVTRVSKNYESPAVGGPAGSPPFLNAVSQVDTTLAPS